MADSNKMNQQNSNNETMTREQGGDRQREQGQFDKNSQEKSAIGGGEQSSTGQNPTGQNPTGQSQSGQGQTVTGQNSQVDKNKSEPTSR